MRISDWSSDVCSSDLLKLKRPLAFFDLETTGLNLSTDRIVEISILKASPDGSEGVKTLKINPEIPISPESSLIHGIYDKDVEGAPKLKEVSTEVTEFIGAADQIGKTPCKEKRG